VLLQALLLLDKLGIDSYKYLSAEYIHLVAEVLKLSLADRDIWYADPAFEQVPLEQLLSGEYTGLRAGLVEMDHASVRHRPGDPLHMKALLDTGYASRWDGGTTTCCIADKWGNVATATPSGWGSAAGPAGSTGIVHGTRLRSFNTSPGHPNCIKPGKRPRTTLTPTLILKNNLPVMAISVEGGDVQDQASLNLILSMIIQGLSPLEALSAPRFSTNLAEDSFNPAARRPVALPQETVLMINKGLDTNVIHELEAKGHRIMLTDEPIGSPVVILFDPASGQWTGATDPLIPHYTGALW
jgi:gamma-glutamyltranspeptidase/glutathione hydrolase